MTPEQIGIIAVAAIIIFGVIACVRLVAGRRAERHRGSSAKNL